MALQNRAREILVWISAGAFWYGRSAACSPSVAVSAAAVKIVWNKCDWNETDFMEMELRIGKTRRVKTSYLDLLFIFRIT